MEEVIEKVNKEDADLILLAGDYVQSQPEPIEEFVSNYLSRLRSKYGVYGIRKPRLQEDSIMWLNLQNVDEGRNKAI